MTTVRCWLCGHEIELSAINFMAAYERYLILTFVLSLMLRFRQYQNNVRFAWAVPHYWPNVLEVIKKHSSIFVTWTTILPVAITFGILLSHTVCYRLIWSEAVVTPEGLREHPVVATFLLPVSLWMIVLDVTTLFRASQMDFTEIERNLAKGEFALTSRALSALRFASFGLFNPRKLVENRVADSLHGVRLALLAQLRAWSFHTAVRISFGFLLWFGYGHLSGHIGQPLFLSYVALLAVWLLMAHWWSHREPEPLTPTTPG